MDREGIFIHAHLLAPEVNYVFIVVNARGGVNTLAEAGVGSVLVLCCAVLCCAVLCCVLQCLAINPPVTTTDLLPKRLRWCAPVLPYNTCTRVC